MTNITIRTKYGKLEFGYDEQFTSDKYHKLAVQILARNEQSDFGATNLTLDFSKTAAQVRDTIADTLSIKCQTGFFHVIMAKTNGDETRYTAGHVFTDRHSPEKVIIEDQCGKQTLLDYSEIKSIKVLAPLRWKTPEL